MDIIDIIIYIISITCTHIQTFICMAQGLDKRIKTNRITDSLNASVNQAQGAGGICGGSVADLWRRADPTPLQTSTGGHAASQIEQNRVPTLTPGKSITAIQMDSVATHSMHSLYRNSNN